MTNTDFDKVSPGNAHFILLVLVLILISLFPAKKVIYDHSVKYDLFFEMRTAIP
jgi:hypothetical protein